MSMINPAATLEITAFEWVPDFAKGYVRDLRLRWACEEAGLPYRERLVSAIKRPTWYFADQPWGQVPVLRDGDVLLFESGACLLHLGELSATLLPRAAQARASAISWLFAAFNSVEPSVFELGRVANFAAGQEWATQRRPSLDQQIAGRIGPLDRHLNGREWLDGSFSVADIAMVTVVRELASNFALGDYPALAEYLERGTARQGFRQAMADQLAPFALHAPA